MLRLLYVCLIALFLGAGAQKLPAQILATNDGAEIRIGDSLVVGVQGGFYNRSGVVYNSSDSLVIGDTIRNDDAGNLFATTLPSGTPILGTTILTDQVGSWTSSVPQSIEGQEPIYFQNLATEGATRKVLNDVNTYVRDTFRVQDAVFDTRHNTATVLNPEVDAVSRTTGYVTSNIGGQLKRAMNTTGDYLFPVGDDTLTTRYRPAFVTPQTTSNDTFGLRFGNYDATTDGFNTNNFNPDSLCHVNDDYYHEVERFGPASGDANLTLTYDPTQDCNFQAMTHWDGLPQWQKFSSAPNSSINVPGLSNLQSGPTTNFSPQPFAFGINQPQVSIQNLDSTFCTNDPVITIDASPGYDASWTDSTVTYEIVDSASGTVIQSGTDSTFDPASLGQGTYEARYILSTSPSCATCQDTANKFFKIGPTPAITVDVSPSPEACEGSPVDFTTTFNDPSQNPANFTYAWNPGPGTSQDTTVADPDPGTLVLSVTVADSLTGCSASATDSTQIIDRPEATVNPLSPNAFCASGETINIDVEPGMNTPPVTNQITLADANGNTVFSGQDTTYATASSTNTGASPIELGPGTYTLIYERSRSGNAISCTDRDTITFTVNPLPDIAVAFTDNPICLGQSTTIEETQNSPNNDWVYDWTPDATPGVQDSFQQTLTPDSPVQNQEIELAVTDTTTGCVNTASQFLTVQDTPQATILASPDQDFICQGSDVTLTAQPASPGSYNYNWFLDGTPFANQQSVNVTDSGTYRVELTNTNTSCEGLAQDSVTLDVRTEPQVTIERSRPGAICDGDSVVLSAEPQTNNFSYVWEYASGRSVIGDTTVVFQSSSINLSVNYQPCPGFDFDDLDSVNVEVDELPRASIETSRDTLFANQPFNVIAHLEDSTLLGQVNYVWDMDEDNEQEITTNDTSATYGGYPAPESEEMAERQIRLQAVGFNGCRFDTTDTVYVEPDVQLFVPDAFTPNGRQGNNTLDLYGEGINMETFEMEVYSRWGNRVIRLTDEDIQLNQRGGGWNGMSEDGTPVPEGVYVYKINVCGYTDNRGDCFEITKRGTITVLR